jgi:hypothetical protein
MRSKILIVLSLVVLAIFTINAYSIYDSAGKSADQLIDESKGIFGHDSGIPENPQEAREIWSKEIGINFTMPSKLSGNSMSTPQTPAVQEARTSSATGVAGSWSFQLRDSKTRQLALNLFQSEEAVFGAGTINDGGDTLGVSASGSAEGDKLNLDVTSLGTISLYRLALTMNGESASGDYRGFSTSERPWSGIANGMRTQTQN